MKCKGFWIYRILIYALGVILVSLGIVLCKKCNLGISPISSIPFVLEDITPWSFGKLTMFFHFFNIAFQMILSKKIFDLKLLLQIPLAFAFGQIIDFLQVLVVFDNSKIVLQLLALVGSVIFTALGMVCMVNAELVQNPPDGVVLSISHKTSIEIGIIKNIYDMSCICISVIVGCIFIQKIKGFGIATIISALFVGQTVSWIKSKKIGIEYIK